jgi:hypothetical protein
MVAMTAREDDFEERLYSYDGWEGKCTRWFCDPFSFILELNFVYMLFYHFVYILVICFVRFSFPFSRLVQSKRRWVYQSPTGSWLLYDPPSNELIDRAYTSGDRIVTLPVPERMTFPTTTTTTTTANATSAIQPNANLSTNNNTLPSHLSSNSAVAKANAASQLTHLASARMTVDFGTGLGQAEGLCVPCVTLPDGRVAAVNYLAVQAEKEKEAKGEKGTSGGGLGTNPRPEREAGQDGAKERPQLLTQKSLFFAQKIINENMVRVVVVVVVGWLVGYCSFL